MDDTKQDEPKKSRGAQVISLRLDEEDRAAVDAAAAEAGVERSEWIRYAVRETLKREPTRVAKGLAGGGGRTLGAHVSYVPGPARRYPVKRIRGGVKPGTGEVWSEQQKPQERPSREL
jgi:hypothetical protein